MMTCKIRLSWNGTDVLEGRATMVAAADILADHIRTQFAGVHHRRYCEDYVRPGQMIDALSAGRPVVMAYSDNTGIAAGEIIPD